MYDRSWPTTGCAATRRQRPRPGVPIVCPRSGPTTKGRYVIEQPSALTTDDTCGIKLLVSEFLRISSTAAQEADRRARRWPCVTNLETDRKRSILNHLGSSAFSVTILG